MKLFTASAVLLLGPVDEPGPLCSGCISNAQRLFRSSGTLQETDLAGSSLQKLLCCLSSVVLGEK